LPLPFPERPDVGVGSGPPGTVGSYLPMWCTTPAASIETASGPSAAFTHSSPSLTNRSSGPGELDTWIWSSSRPLAMS
jgi:hypothetical protein